MTEDKKSENEKLENIEALVDSMADTLGMMNTSLDILAASLTVVIAFCRAQGMEIPDWNERKDMDAAIGNFFEDAHRKIERVMLNGREQTDSGS